MEPARERERDLKIISKIQNTELQTSGGAAGRGE
jgi:hypothetical protein